MECPAPPLGCLGDLFSLVWSLRTAYIGVSRGPQTLWPSGQKRKPEITPLGVPQTSFHGRVGLLLVRQNRHHILSGRSGFFPCHKGIKGVFQNLLQAFGSIPCVASSATTWVNLPDVGGQLTRMYQVRQWACNRHFGYGRTSAQYRLKSSTRVTLSSLSGTIIGLRWKGRSLFQFLPDSSVSHLNYESRNFDIRYVGHQ